MDTYNTDFWRTLDELVRQSKIVIDRPKGTVHPNFVAERKLISPTKLKIIS